MKTNDKELKTLYEVLKENEELKAIITSKDRRIKENEILINQLYARLDEIKKSFDIYEKQNELIKMALKKGVNNDN